MREQTPSTIRETNFKITVNLHTTDGTHWVLVIRREGGQIYHFDSFAVETPPLFFKEYVDLGSDERLKENDEFYCRAYCLYMIYIIDRAVRIKSALNNISVNQVKYQGMYNEFLCLNCKGKVDYELKLMMKLH